MVNLMLAASNILLASMVMAWFMSFLTPQRARESLRLASRAPKRWRRGVALLVLGLVTLLPAQVPDLLPQTGRLGFYAVGYPLMYGGVVLHASSTWKPREVAS